MRRHGPSQRSTLHFSGVLVALCLLYFRASPPPRETGLLARAQAQTRKAFKRPNQPQQGYHLALFTTRYFAPAIPSPPAEGSTEPTSGPASEPSPWPPPPPPPPLLSHVALDTVDLGDAGPEGPPNPSPAVAAEGCSGCRSVGVWLAGLLGGSGGGFFGLLLSPDGGGDAAVAAPAFSSMTGGASSSTSALRPPPPPAPLFSDSDSGPRRSSSSSPLAKGFNDEEAVTKGLVGLVDGPRRSSTNGFRLVAAA